MTKIYSFNDIESWKKLKKTKKLIKVLNKGDESSRIHAIKTLGEIKAKEALDDLLLVSNDDNAEIRRSAAITLAELGDMSGIEEVIEALGDRDFLIIERVKKALFQLKKKALKPLLKALDHYKSAECPDGYSSQNIMSFYKKNSEIVKSIIIILASISDPKAIDAILKEIEENPGYTRLPSVKAIVNKKRPEVIKCLIKALDNEWAGVRRSAASVLGDYDEIQVIDRLILALRDSDYIVCENAKSSLLNFGKKKVIKKLIQSLQNENAEARVISVKLLGEFDGSEVFDSLIHSLDDENQNVKREAIAALGKIGNSRAIEHIEKYMEDVDLQTTASDALLKLKWQPPKDKKGAMFYINTGQYGKCVEIGDAAIDTLLKKLEDKNLDVLYKKGVIEVLGEIGDERIFNNLITCLGSNDGHHFTELVSEIIKKLSKNPLEVFIKALDNEDIRIKSSMINILGRLGDQNVIEHLIKLLDIKEQVTREGVIFALETIKKSDIPDKDKKKILALGKVKKRFKHMDYTYCDTHHDIKPSFHNFGKE